MRSPINRRAFLRHNAALGGLACGFGLSRSGPETAVEAEEPPIIDTHQHLWDLERFHLPWLERNPSLNRSFLMSDYLEASRGLGIVQTVYMEVDVEPSQQVAEAEYVLGIGRQGGTPMVAAVISGRPSAEGFRTYLDRFGNQPALKGVRQVLHGASTPPGYCLDPAFVTGIRLLGERGLSFDLCVRSRELNDAAKLVATCPDTSFVLDHCGNPNVRDRDQRSWKADIERLARLPNVVCKVSGFIASAAPDPWTVEDLTPIVVHVLDTFGPDRVVFGGDWPVCTRAASLRQWVEALRSIVQDRPLAERRKLFHDNAVRVYRLSTTRNS
jgi:L-fuconolactonase